jgi:hypothetical protein
LSATVLRGDVGGQVVYDIKCDYTTLQYINTYNDIGREGWHTAVKENKRALVCVCVCTIRSRRIQWSRFKMTVGNKSSRNSRFIYGKTIIIIRTWVPNSVTTNMAITYLYICVCVCVCVCVSASKYIRLYVYT